jgi:uncharacterized protein YdeI (YjbR/CyaY-like superfamily)
MMEEQLLFADREEFRQWLFKNHDTNQGFWMVLGKSGKIKTIKPDEALEEALCFGWIDGLIKSIDDTKYLKKFSPRRKGSNWSERNKGLANKLIENRKMTVYGMKAIEEAKKSGNWDIPRREAVTDSQIEILIKDLNGTEPALSNFLKMPLSIRRTYTGFYLDAKQEETRRNRLKKIIERLNQNKKPME